MAIHGNETEEKQPTLGFEANSVMELALKGHLMFRIRNILGRDWPKITLEDDGQAGI